MKTYKYDDKLYFDTCEHLAWNEKDKIFNLITNDSGFPIGVDESGHEHILFMCLSCWERMENRAFTDFISKLNIKFQIKNGNVIELSSKYLWRKFLELLKVTDLKVDYDE